MDPTELKLFYHPKERLRLTLGEEKSSLTVKPLWAAPLSRPHAFLALLDGKGEEIVLVPPPEVWPADSREAVQRALRQRSLTATVTAVRDAREEEGATDWTVET